MSSAWRIALKDAHEARRDRRFQVAVATLLTVIALAAAAGWSSAASGRQARDAAQSAERAFWVGQGDVNPHAAAHFGAFVFKPVSPLSAIDPGLDPHLGTSTFLEAHQQELAQHTPADDSSPMVRWSTLTAAVALQVITPLLIVLATAPALVRERELGTLRQMASAGVPRRVLIAGKLLGSALPLALVLVPLALFGAVAVALSSRGSADLGLRTTGLLLAYLGYFSMWACLGLTISARARSSSTAAGVAFAIWMLLVVVAPSAALAASAGFSPANGSAAFTQRIEAARRELPRWVVRVADVEERFLSGTLELSPGLPSNPEVVALVEAEADETALYERELARLSAAHRETARGYRRWSIAAPSVAIQTLSMALAGTDAEHHWHFLDAAAGYRRQFLQTLNAELASYTALDTFDFARGRDFWGSIPAFTYQPPTLAESLSDQQWSLAALAAWCVSAGGVLLWSLRSLRATLPAR